MTKIPKAVLVTGGRHYSDIETLEATLDLAHRQMGISYLIEGGATGADRLARAWARRHGVPVMTFEAHWKEMGPKAGPIRNQWMLAFGKPDILIAFPGGRGTANMIAQARTEGVEVFEIAEGEPRVLN